MPSPWSALHRPAWAGGYQRTVCGAMCPSTRFASVFSTCSGAARQAPGAARRCSGAARQLVEVAVGHRHVEVLVLAVALRQVLRDRHRAVTPARAADREHQMWIDPSAEPK